MQFVENYFSGLAADLVRYILFAGIPFVIYYVLFKSALFRFKIQQKFPEFHHIRREILYSLSSIAIFSVVSVAVFVAQQNGYTQVYTDIKEHSMTYFIFSVFAFIFIHDAFFYWGPRFMHIKKIYPYVHRIHHKSINPTPWAAFAFHPIEAFIQVLILPLVLFTVPMHPLAIFIWSMYQLLLNVGGHLGFEMFRSGFTQRIVSKWHNTSTHHNMHHKYVNCNYGLYFNIWDRLMGTNHAKYSEEYEAVCERRGKIFGQSSVMPPAVEVEKA